MDELRGFHGLCQRTLLEFGEGSELDESVQTRLDAALAVIDNALNKPPKRLGKLTPVYMDAHIKKMAMWRTLLRFSEWLFDEWIALAHRQQTEAARAALGN